ncbi:DUF4332 domain-containing protein [Candidatus Bathyarchaeota archaeon]|nr:DUF4332 domain-containing protein [Candidatus Bathyarchaeota archaeon]
MRTDYVLYVVAVICFAITGLTFALIESDFERNLSVLTTVILGLLFIALGFSQRPRLSTSVETPATPVPALVQQATSSVVEETKIEIAESKPVMELTSVKGIKQKRADQLKALGINSVQDLANASAEDLAAKLKISPWFTQRWIQSAKELVEKS